MKYTIIIILALFFIACDKEDCRECMQIIETNFDEAQAKCNGWANRWPNGFTVEMTTTHRRCYPFPETVDKVYPMCNGIDYTIRERWVCN